jgi:formate dehydrogenase assembly factor FdhD
LLAEGVLKSADDLGTIEHCDDPKADRPENIANASLTNRCGETLDRLLAERRNVTTNSSCGLCGRLTIESLRTDAPALSAAWTIAASTLADIPDRLRAGRTSYEIVQKAFYAGIPVVAAVSAPSSLAIELAEDCGMTLIGFLRGTSLNIYSHPERVVW